MAVATFNLPDWLDACCRVLDEELARQRTVLETCHAQGRAARARDVAELEALTRELTRHIEAAVRAERDRMTVVRGLVDHFELAPDEQNLTTLIRRSPEPWAARLKKLQVELRTVVATTQRVVNANARYLNEGVRTTNRLLDALFGRTESREGYDNGGRTADGTRMQPAMLNTAG